MTTLVRQVESLVTRAAAVRASELPGDVLDHIGLVFADCVGVMAAGARSAEIVALLGDPSLRLADAPDRVSGSRIFGVPRRYGDPATVAWLNGTAGTFLELDEGFRPTGHPAIQVVPAALAVAEAAGARGSELSAAIAAGYEVAARLFECFRLPRAMHPHGHFGAIGAATAVATLRRSDPVALARIAATQPLLTGWEACFEGATARNTWCGHANRAGVLADTLHRAGFTGSLRSLLSVVEPYAAHPEVLDEPVEPDGLRIRRNYFKFHSACALNHSTLDAVRLAWDGVANRDPWTVRQIEVTTVAANLRIDRLPEPNALSTRFSLPYAVAAALLTGSTGPASFQWSESVAEYARRVRVTSDPVMDAQWPRDAPARVRITTPTGVSEATVRNPRGHHACPPDRHELRDKFVSLVRGDSRSDDPARLARCFDTLAGLATATDCSTLPFPQDNRPLNSADVEV